MSCQTIRIGIWTWTTLAAVLLPCTLGRGAPFRPPGLKVGELYHLAFVTRDRHNAVNSTFDIYNGFVIDQAALNPQLTGTQSFASGNRWAAVVAGTLPIVGPINPRQSANVMGPVYTVTGSLLAVDEDDLWDGSIDSPFNVDQFGRSVEPDLVFTGSLQDGTASPGAELGNSVVEVGRTDATGQEWITNNGVRTANIPLRFYAVSQALQAPLDSGPLTLELNLNDVVGTGSMSNFGSALDSSAKISYFQNPNALSQVGVDALPGGATVASYRGPAGNDDGTVNGISLVLDSSVYGEITLTPFTGAGGGDDVFAVDQTDALNVDQISASNGLNGVTVGSLDITAAGVTATFLGSQPDADEFQLEAPGTDLIQGDHTEVVPMLQEFEVYLPTILKDSSGQGSLGVMAEQAGGLSMPTGMVEINLSGFIDGEFGTATITGHFVTVPEPSSALLAVFSLLACLSAWLARRWRLLSADSATPTSHEAYSAREQEWSA